MTTNEIANILSRNYHFKLYLSCSSKENENNESITLNMKYTSAYHKVQYMFNCHLISSANELLYLLINYANLSIILDNNTRCVILIDLSTVVDLTYLLFFYEDLINLVSISMCFHVCLRVIMMLLGENRENQCGFT